jgi:hypothetical protein
MFNPNKEYNMKAKLIKKEDDFYSLKVDGFVMATSSGMLVDYKLSKENCDKLFEVVDVDYLVDKFVDNLNVSEKVEKDVQFGYQEGLIKAMELMGYKKYTDDDIVGAFMAGHLRGMSTDMGEDNPHPICSEYLNSIQQPREIEVEILTGTLWRQIDVIDPITHTCKSHISKSSKEEPMLDKNGCLILKKL